MGHRPLQRYRGRCHCGAVTFEMRRFSQLEGWTPTKVFNEHIQYKAAATGSRRPSLANGE